MHTALYYPHTTLRDARLLKTALLLWDRLEFIAPWEDFEPDPQAPDFEAARELIVRPYVPDDDDKAAAHESIAQLLADGIPDWFRFPPSQLTFPYLIWPQKLLPETWELLEDSDLARPEDHGPDMETTGPAGLTAMSILAECCAGSVKRTVTDRIDSYAALTRYLTTAHDGVYGSPDSEHDRLVTISLEIIDPQQFELEQLLDLRRREQSSSEGAELRALRHAYLAKIDEFASKLTDVGGHQGSRDEIVRSFRQFMSDDVKQLKEAIRLGATQTVLSKEVAVGVLAAAGTAVPPLTVASGVIGVGALLKLRSSYRARQKATLRKHAASWLLELDQAGKFTDYHVD